MMPRSHRARQLVVASVAVLAATAAHAQQPPAAEPPRMRAVRLEVPLRIDGALDEQIYRDVEPLSGFVQVEPQVGVPATEKTDVWIAFDGDNFYLAFRCWDTHPERRVATELRRDGNAIYAGNDVINFFLDTFYDRRNGLSLTVNSIGGRSEGQVTNGVYDADWNPIWRVATATFDGGWTVELALPFKSIRYREGDEQLWGFNALRTVRWRNELSVLVPVPQWRGMNAVRQPQLAGTIVGIQAPPSGKNLEIKPYVVSNVTTDASGRPTIANKLDNDIGLDVKYGVTQNMVANFTYNTDFAQVEADEQQVNLTRFSLFFPEKRDFFLENQGTFAFGGAAGRGADGDTPVMFYSRRIGLEGGRQVPIVGGGRLTGRVGRYTLGLVDIQAEAAPIPGARSTNFSAVRVKRDIFSRSSIGLLFTGRSHSQTTSGANAALGADATFNIGNFLTINSYWARTQTDGLRGDDQSYRTQLDYNGDRYGMQAEHMAIGRHFNPELGFVRRSDIRRSFGLFRFSPRPRGMPSIRKFSWTGAAMYIEDFAGRVQAREQNLDFGIELQNGDILTASYVGNYEFVPRPFRIATSVTVPIGGYHFNGLAVGYAIAQQRAISAALLVEHGSFYSGHRTAFTASRGRFNLQTRLSLEPTYSLNFVDLAEGQFTTHLAGTRATYTMTSQMFTSALVQFNSSTRAVSANVRLRWEYRPGSELFVVYNDERNTHVRGFPELATRSFIVKVNRLFRF